MKFLTVILLDISSSLINGLGDSCNNFYKKILDYLAQYMVEYNVHVYLFPALRTSGYVEFTLLKREDLDELVNKICSPRPPRGTPLIRAIDNVLKSEKKISKLIIASDLLSDYSDSTEPINEVVRGLSNIELSVVWLINQPKPGQSIEPFASLVKKLFTQRTKYPEDALEGRDVAYLLARAQDNKVLRFMSVNIYDIRGFVDYYINSILKFIT